jgi:hypothetical protein
MPHRFDAGGANLVRGIPASTQRGNDPLRSGASTQLGNDHLLRNDLLRSGA